jgi:hypothetical protein
VRLSVGALQSVARRVVEFASKQSVLNTSVTQLPLLMLLLLLLL